MTKLTLTGRPVWLSIIFCFLFGALVHAQSTDKIDLDVKDVPLSEVLAAIEKQSGTPFLYNRQQVEKIRVSVASYRQRPLKEVLNHLLPQYQFGYKLEGGNIILIPQEKKGSPTPQKKDLGKVTGKVIDEENGQPVVNASIRIGSRSIVVGVDGSFALNLAPGNYQAEVSSIGYAKKIVTDIIVKDNGTFQLNLTLKRQKGQLSAVVITASAKRESVASLYTRQRNNAAITDGISAEQIARTPDNNIGESLKRISGLSTIDNKYVVVRGLSERYNQAMLNGQVMPSTELNRKQFSFDIIPSNMVDHVTVSKTITPDKSAEFGGGLVEVTTKDIPTENFLALSAGTTINSLTAGKDLLSLKRGNSEYFGSYASRRNLFGRKEWQTLNEIRGYQYQHRTETIMTNNWQPYHYAAMPSQNYQVSLGRVIDVDSSSRNKLGVIASVSYRNNQSIQGIATERNGYTSGSGNFMGNQYGFSTSIGGLLGVGYATARHKISWQSLFTRLLDEQLNYGIGEHSDFGPNAHGLFEKVLQTTLFQSQLKGEHTIGGKGIKVNWVGSYSRVERIRPDNHALLWKSPVGLEGSNEFNVAEANSGGFGAGPAADPGVLRQYSSALENNFSWDANVSLPFKVSVTKNVFKVGYAGWYKDRRFYVAQMGDYGGRTASAPPLGLLFTPEFGGGRSVVSEFGDDYHRKAPLHAIYGMFDDRIAEKLRIVWGLRAEYLNMDKINQAIQGIIAEVTPGTSLDDFSALYNKTKSWQFFPSANLTYSILPKLNFRLAYARSIVRPDLRELAYFREYDFELGGNYQADFLRPTIIRNYDVRLEWYPGAGEIVSASFFYKNIQLPMEIYQNQDMYTLKNNYSSSNRGIELEVRKSLAFIPVPVIKNLTLYGNFTYVNSRVTPMRVNITTDPNDIHKIVYQPMVGTEEKRPLSGLSNYLFNAGMYYDDSRLHLSLSYNSVSNRMVIYNENKINWQFEKPIQALDLQLAYRFLKHKMEVKVNISNLLDQSNIIYVNRGTPEEMLNAGKGINTQKYLLYDKKKDLILQKLTPGRNYGCTISYNF